MSESGVEGARAHRRLRVQLRKGRRRAGLTQAQVKDKLDWSISKVARIESGEVKVTPSDVRLLHSLYEMAPGVELEGLLDLAKQARNQPWLQFRDVHNPAFLRVVALEAGASVIWHMQPHFVPGLFHTPEYRRAILNDAQLTAPDPATVERILQALEKRQQILAANDPPTVKAFIDEGVLTRPIGGRQVLRDQLSHLADLAQRPNISLRIIPLAIGGYRAMRNAFVRLEFDDEDPDALYIEGVNSDVVIQDDADNSDAGHELQNHISALTQLDTVALSETDSLDVLKARLEQLTEN